MMLEKEIGPVYKTKGWKGRFFHLRGIPDLKEGQDGFLEIMFPPFNQDSLTFTREQAVELRNFLNELLTHAGDVIKSHLKFFKVGDFYGVVLKEDATEIVGKYFLRGRLITSFILKNNPKYQVIDEKTFWNMASDQGHHRTWLIELKFS